MTSILKNIFFKTPKNYTIVIFDEKNNKIIKNIIPYNYSSYLYSTRKIKIFISFKILIRFLRNYNLLFDNFSFKKKNELFLYAIVRKIKSIYLKTLVDIINPKVVISYIDNSTHLHFLCKHGKSYKVIGIQNGSRNIHNTDFSNYYLDYFFCYGEHEKDLFIKNNAKIKKFIPCGSLRASLSSDINLLKKANKFDLLIVSGWRGNSDPDNRDGSIETMKAMYKMDRLLAKIILEKKYNYSIALRSKAGGTDWNMKGWGNEEDYYKKIYGENTAFHYFDHEEGQVRMPIYNLMLKSNLSITVLSTAVFEAFGYGKKILLCNFTGGNEFHCWDDLIVTNNDTLKGLSDVIDDLLCDNIDHKKYMTYSKYIMNYPDKILVEDFIKDQIIKILG